MSAKPTIPTFMTSADGLAENTAPALLVLDLTRNEIEFGNVASALERLMALTDTRESALLYRESLLFQVSGYDHDARELPEIPEVRAFFARLTQEWPHWLWFLHRGTGAIPLLFALLCQVTIHRAVGAYGTEFLDSKEVNRCIVDLVERGSALFNAFAISKGDAEESTQSAVAEILESWHAGS